jgi:RimJ/RimL family protein N-acetyltransferase
MKISISKVPLKDLGTLRAEFLGENGIEFCLDKCHLYGWADTYSLLINDSVAGYGSVWGKDDRKDRDSIFEFYLKKEYRDKATEIFAEFISSCGAGFIEAQSNDKFLAPMVFEFAHEIYAESILFEESFESVYNIPGAELVAKGVNDVKNNDQQFELKFDSEVVATGGLMLNYNFPYADIYYGVEEKHRRKGFGTLIVQELKKEAYKIGRVPAARCGINNTVSKRTMMKAGLRICGWRLVGKIKDVKISGGQ